MSEHDFIPGIGEHAFVHEYCPCGELVHIPPGSSVYPRNMPSVASHPPSRRAQTPEYTRPVVHAGSNRLSFSFGQTGVQTGHALLPVAKPPRPYGIFEAHFDNAKRRAGKPVQKCECYGSLYPDGHVHLHTRSVEVTDFVSVQEMMDYLESYGMCAITWLDEVL